MKSKTMAKLKDYLPLYLMMIPGLAYLIINNYIPMFGIVVAFKKFNIVDGIYGSPWNGLKNFEYLFASNDALTIIRNTMLNNVAFILVNNIVGIELDPASFPRIHRGRQLYRFCAALPRKWYVQCHSESFRKRSGPVVQRHHLVAADPDRRELLERRRLRNPDLYRGYRGYRQFVL